MRTTERSFPQARQITPSAPPLEKELEKTVTSQNGDIVQAYTEAYAEPYTCATAPPRPPSISSFDREALRLQEVVDDKRFFSQKRTKAEVKDNLLRDYGQENIADVLIRGQFTIREITLLTGQIEALLSGTKSEDDIEKIVTYLLGIRLGQDKANKLLASYGVTCPNFVQKLQSVCDTQTLMKFACAVQTHTVLWKDERADDLFDAFTTLSTQEKSFLGYPSNYSREEFCCRQGTYGGEAFRERLRRMGEKEGLLANIFYRKYARYREVAISASTDDVDYFLQERLPNMTDVARQALRESLCARSANVEQYLTDPSISKEIQAVFDELSNKNQWSTFPVTSLSIAKALSTEVNLQPYIHRICMGGKEQADIEALLPYLTLANIRCNGFPLPFQPITYFLSHHISLTYDAVRIMMSGTLDEKGTLAHSHQTLANLLFSESYTPVSCVKNYLCKSLPDLPADTVHSLADHLVNGAKWPEALLKTYVDTHPDKLKELSDCAKHIQSLLRTSSVISNRDLGDSQIAGLLPEALLNQKQRDSLEKATQWCRNFCPDMSLKKHIFALFLGTATNADDDAIVVWLCKNKNSEVYQSPPIQGFCTEQEINRLIKDNCAKKKRLIEYFKKHDHSLLQSIALDENQPAYVRFQWHTSNKVEDDVYYLMHKLPGISREVCLDILGQTGGRRDISYAEASEDNQNRLIAAYKVICPLTPLPEAYACAFANKQKRERLETSAVPIRTQLSSSLDSWLHPSHSEDSTEEAYRALAVDFDAQVVDFLLYSCEESPEDIIRRLNASRTEQTNSIIAAVEEHFVAIGFGYDSDDVFQLINQCFDMNISSALEENIVERLHDEKKAPLRVNSLVSPEKQQHLLRVFLQESSMPLRLKEKIISLIKASTIESPLESTVNTIASVLICSNECAEVLLGLCFDLPARDCEAKKARFATFLMQELTKEENRLGLFSLVERYHRALHSLLGEKCPSKLDLLHSLQKIIKTKRTLHLTWLLGNATSISTGYVALSDSADKALPKPIIAAADLLAYIVYKEEKLCGFSSSPPKICLEIPESIPTALDEAYSASALLYVKRILSESFPGLDCDDVEIEATNTLLVLTKTTDAAKRKKLIASMALRDGITADEFIRLHRTECPSDNVIGLTSHTVGGPKN